MKDCFLSSEQGREYLLQEYVSKERSTYEIAEEQKTYPNFIRRMLKFHKIKLRNKSEAQKKALKTGRHTHPTKGKERSPKEKLNISEGMAKVWENMTNEEKQNRSELAKKDWDSMSESEKKEMFSKAGKAVRKAADEGSKLEKYLIIGLKVKGFKADFHKEFIISAEKMHVDIFLPDNKIAIEIDGPTHHLPIWGEEKLQKNQLADMRKNGLLINQGYNVIRIKNLAKNLSEFKMRTLLTNLINMIESIKATDRNIHNLEV